VADSLVHELLARACHLAQLLDRAGRHEAGPHEPMGMELGEPPGDLAAANAEWQRRRDETLRQLAGLPVVRPAGAWSLLLDVATLGLDPREVSRRLLERKVAATPMVGWGGPIADRHVRFVFSNEPVERLSRLGERVRAALGR